VTVSISVYIQWSVVVVKAVANDIEIRVAASSERNDADIAAAAVRALEWDAFVPDDKLDVTVSKGWVTLKGEVQWQYQKQDAEKVVRRLSGAKGVTNLITVKPYIAPSPSDLKSRIEQALLRSAELDAKRITVEVDGSKVTLKGTVRSWAEKEEAARQAWLALGAGYEINKTFELDGNFMFNGIGVSNQALQALQVPSGNASVMSLTFGPKIHCGDRGRHRCGGLSVDH
jgi:osmotically-inducible protein OsmY